MCKILTATNTPFREMCRKQEQVDRFRNNGMDAVLGDFDRPDTLFAAMTCMATMFLITPSTRDQFAQEVAAIDAAKRAGGGRIVKLSASDGNVRSPVPWARTHALIDHHLRAAGITWRILTPTAFMQNFQWLKYPIARAFLPQVAGKGSVSWIDKREVARVAATVLTEQGHEGPTYFLTGPETLDMAEATRRLTAVIGHKVRYLNLPTPACRAILRLTGNSRGMAKGLISQFADVVAGHHDIHSTFEIERLADKPPHGFVDFVREHLRQFAKAAA